MPTYCFILGRTPLLSLAELAHTLQGARLIDGGSEGIVVGLGKIIDDPVALLRCLGGTQKIGMLVAECHENVEKKIVETLARELPRDGKRPFAISVLFGDIPHQDEISLKNILKKSKKGLREMGYSVRFVNNDFKNATTVTIEKENLLKKGIDLSVIQTREKIFIAKTLAVQPFAAYSRRDYDRPARDARSGMIPPKLAQMMINCTRKNYVLPKTIYDPFCGCGTILMEAMLLQCDIRGSDIEPNAVQNTEQNINWLCKTFMKNAGKPFPALKLFQKDATKLIQEDLPQNEFAIVTEPFLGPPQIETVNETEFAKITTQLAALYKTFFQNLRPLLPEKTQIVIAFPTFHIGKDYREIPGLIEKIRSLGYSTAELVPEQWKNFTAKKEGPGIHYRRKDQLIGRQIVKFLPQ